MTYDLSALSRDLLALLPMVVVTVWACVLLLVDIFIFRERKSLTALSAGLGLLVALGLALFQDPLAEGESIFFGMVVVDRFALFMQVLFLASGLVGVALAYDYLKRLNIERGEYYVLLMLAIGGMMLMATAIDLIIVFLALEMLSFPLYVLSGIARPRSTSEEAGLKYFLLGAFSSSFVVYGIALVFGATGTTSMAGIFEAVAGGTIDSILLVIGAALVLIGLAFKVAVVPFHMWTPDVYHGAPTALVGFMAVGSKVAGFAALLRLFVSAFPGLAESLTPVLWGLAALTMIVGNVVAISQTNIKRLLAYSSIAHAGYILMALVPFGQPEVAQQSVAAALVYLVAYATTSFAAWAVVIALERCDDECESDHELGLNLEDYAGLGRRHPVMAAVMTVAMLSFTGIPPTLGFVGKFYLFRTALEGGFVGLALIGVITSLVSAYYYLRVVVLMYMREGEPAVRDETFLNLAALTGAVATIVLTFFAGPLFELAARAVLRLF